MPTEQIADRRPIASVLRRFAAAPVRWCVRLNIHPNLISLASIAASMGAAMCFLYGSSRMVALSGVVLCFVRLYFNMLDGMVAIASGKASAAGEIANELPDRISDVLIFVGLGHGMLMNPILGYWAAIGSLLVAYVGTLGKAVGAHRDFSGPMSKPWRMVAVAVVVGTVCAIPEPTSPMMAFAPFPYVEIMLLVVVVGCGITIVRRLVRIVKALNAQKATVL